MRTQLIVNSTVPTSVAPPWLWCAYLILRISGQRYTLVFVACCECNHNLDSRLTSQASGLLLKVFLGHVERGKAPLDSLGKRVLFTEAGSEDR